MDSSRNVLNGTWMDSSGMSKRVDSSRDVQNEWIQVGMS